jgi:hypothetical protein
MSTARNILGGELALCSCSPMTGFHRDGYCDFDPRDPGQHTVCAMVDEDFLSYTASRGNDLSTPRPEFGFAGLKPGDHWCLCAARWLEAEQAGHAPRVNAEATHESALKIIPKTVLMSYVTQ